MRALQMESVKRWRAAGPLVMLTALMAMAGCESRISVSAGANVPAQYSHVWVTVQQVWINQSATAPAEDAGWVKFPLTTSQTLDLVNLSNGALSQLAADLTVPPGTYHQMRLILSDTSGTASESAQSAGAQFNNEVDFVDTDGTTQQLPLAVPNAAQGVGVPIELKVLTPTSAILGALSSTSGTGTPTDTSGFTGLTDTTGTTGITGTTGTTGTNNTTGTTGSGVTDIFGNPVDTSTTNTTDTSTTTPSDSTTDNNGVATVTANAAVVFDATRDIAPFLTSGQPGFVLSPMLSGTDLSDVGTIASQIDISAITNDANTSRPDIEVTAETPSSDGTRNVVVLSAPMRSDGTFVLYPFPMTDDSPTTYDLVIHGPRVQTVIIKGVPVSAGNPTTAATVPLGLISLALADSYAVNVAAAKAVTPRSARVGFYQTPAGSNQLPYVIEERPVDPLSGLFAEDQLVSSANILSGSFVSGQTALTSAAPVEGAGAYRVAASAPLYGDGTLSTTAVAPPAAGTTTAVTFAGPTVDIPAGSTSSTITATVSVATPGRYDKGAVVITHDGAIVAVAALDSVLVPQQASGKVTPSAIPGGSDTQTFDSGVYYAEVWVWNSSDPAGTFSRQPSSTAVDLRTAAAGTIDLSIS